MKAVPTGTITRHIEQFLRADDAEPKPVARRRERSWDFCFNHFQDHPQPTQAMELSCLHLGYYLASWGMLRGSSFLFRETNLRHYRATIDVIQQHNPALRGVDVDSYCDPATDGARDAAWRDLRHALLPKDGQSITLVSKVMMGVWGCLPSYDTFFIRTFRSLSESRKERGAFGRASRLSRAMLAEFYREHAEEIETLRLRYPTLDLDTGLATERLMTRAKVIDIFGFQRSYSGSND